jgi:hypothetical protein
MPLSHALLSDSAERLKHRATVVITIGFRFQYSLCAQRTGNMTKRYRVRVVSEL